jgi:parallel beta-helix repeat protein
MRSFVSVTALGVATAVGPGCGNTPPPPSGPECVSFTATSSEHDIAGAVARAKDGACISLAAGTYTFHNQLAFGTGNGVTLSGAGMGQTILDFSGQVVGEDSIFAQSVTGFTLKGFTVRDSPGNGVKTLGVTGVTFDSLEVTWTGSDPTKHGAYGLYPVQSKNVLIQGSKVSGGSDSGVYVGQSQQIVVRNNEVFANVAGIEIENSWFADVHDNHAHDNTAGILVFSLPQLQQEGGHDVHVYSNTIENNNTANFAAAADIVSILPAGTGFFVMACDRVEVSGNTFTGNKTGAGAVIEYADTQLPINDSAYYPFSSNVYFHDNMFSNNGTTPDGSSQFGLLLETGIGAFPDMRVPDLFWDGIPDPTKGTDPNAMHICVQQPSPSTFCNLNLTQLNSTNSNLSQIATCSSPAQAPFACTLPTLAAVSFPGLSP